MVEVQSLLCAGIEVVYECLFRCQFMTLHILVLCHKISMIQLRFCKELDLRMKTGSPVWVSMTRLGCKIIVSHKSERRIQDPTLKFENRFDLLIYKTKYSIRLATLGQTYLG